MLNRIVQSVMIIALLVGIAVVPAYAQDGGDDDVVELTETFTFPSDVSFGYPDTWALDEATANDFFVVLTAQDVLAAFLQVYDLPALYGDMALDMAFIQQTYGDSAAGTWGFDFSVEDFGQEIGMSRTQVHRKLKAITGKSTSQYIRSIKLSRAREMLRDPEGNISEVAYAVGFSSLAYFSRCFKEEFGHSPSSLS